MTDDIEPDGFIPITAPPTYAELAPFLAEPRIHRVARCRWCRAPFVLIYGTHWICPAEACGLRQMEHAILRPHRRPDASPFLFLPLPLNVELIESPYKRTLIAGAAGASKSYGSRWLVYIECIRRPGLRVLLLRVSYDELTKNHLQFIPAEVEALGCAHYSGGSYRRLSFDNGSQVFFGYCDTEADVQRQMGPEWDLVVVEEASSLLPFALASISSRDRGSSTATYPAGQRDGKTWMLSNPGGRAMLYLYDTYISRKPDLDEYPAYLPDIHGYIHATLDDNPYLSETYAEKNLSGLPRARYEQLRWGRWDIFASQFFDVDETIHVQALEPV